MSDSVEIRIGMAETFLVDLDTSAVDDDYTLPSSGLKYHIGPPDSPETYAVVDPEIEETTEGQALVTLPDTATEKFLPGYFVGHLVDEAGPYFLCEVEHEMKFGKGAFTITGPVRYENESLTLSRGADHMGTDALFFALSGEVEVDWLLFASIDGERVAECEVVTPRIAKVELDAEDLADVGTAARFCIEADSDTGTHRRFDSVLVMRSPVSTTPAV